jgi:5'-nucleotidase
VTRHISKLCGREVRLASHALAALALAACASVAPSGGGSVELRIVAFNDFHGHIERAALMAGAIRDLRANASHTIVVAAGDLVGASPIESSLLRDEPAVDLLGRLGLEVSAAGNHEFDHGVQELVRLQKRAGYDWLAANVVERASGRTLLPPYAIREFGGVAVAFIGVALRSTPQIVSPAGVRGYEFRDEAASVNALVPELRARGVEAIVVLIHEGGRSSTPPGADGCANFEGPIIGIVKRLDRAVDLVVSGHTHEAYTCEVDGRTVTSALSYGRVLTAIDVTLDRATRDVKTARAKNYVLESAGFVADPHIAAEVTRVKAISAPRAERVVGHMRGELTQSPNESGESNLGDVVAHAHLEAMRPAGAQAAFTNPGGLRAPIAGRGPRGEVTFGQLYAAQPFGNNLVAITLTGAQVLRVLESQWRSAAQRVRILQVAGITYSWDGSKPPGQRVIRGSVRVAGAPIEPGASYRIVVNSYLADGGDGFSVFREGADRQGGPLDVEALEQYFTGRALKAAAPGERITRVDR